MKVMMPHFSRLSLPPPPPSSSFPLNADSVCVCVYNSRILWIAFIKKSQYDAADK